MNNVGKLSRGSTLDSPTRRPQIIYFSGWTSTTAPVCTVWLGDFLSRQPLFPEDDSLVVQLRNTAMGEKKRKAGSEKSDRPSKKAQTDRVRVSHVASPDIAKPVVGKYSRIDED